MSENTSSSNQNTPKIIAAIVVLLVIIGAVLYSTNSRKSSESENIQDDQTLEDTKPMDDPEGDGSWGDLDVVAPATNSSSSAPVTPKDNPTTSPSSSSYKDGEYTASGNYTAPSGPEKINVTLTLKSGKVVSAVFAGEAINQVSVGMQAKFKSGFEQLVVGKSIDEVKLGVVNGSSLTPKGFMDALAKIKTQAKS